MTNQELLELAARAAGIHIDKSPYNGGGIGNTGFDMNGNAVLDWHNNKRWNPLTDDGDAQRLAVKLQITMRNFGHVVSVVAPRQFQVDEYTNGDEYAATRRCIVRAAAEIGKQMKQRMAL